MGKKLEGTKDEIVSSDTTYIPTTVNTHHTLPKDHKTKVRQQEAEIGLVKLTSLLHRSLGWSINTVIFHFILSKDLLHKCESRISYI